LINKYQALIVFIYNDKNGKKVAGQSIFLLSEY